MNFIGFACTSWDLRCPEIDLSIWREWQPRTLLYLWVPVAVVIRIWFVFHRRSDPRWSRKRWKAKT